MDTLLKRISGYILSAGTRDEIHVRVLLIVFALSCIVIHGGLFMVISLAMGVTAVVKVNIVSVLAYAVMLLLTHKRRYNEAALLATAEITMYSMVNQFMLGGNCQSFVFLLLLTTVLLHLFVDYASISLRLLIAFVSMMLTGFTAWYGQFSGAPASIKLTESQIYIYMMTYLIVGILSIVFGLLLQLFTREYVNRLDEKTVKELSFTAYTDNLTGLYNRQYAQTLFDDLQSREQTPFILVAMVDIDNFKHVNDTFGHDVGDIVLKIVSEISKTHFRSTDYVFRWGGEEILILLMGAKMKNGVATLNVFREKINSNERIKSKLGYYLSVTIGASDFDINNIQESIKIADARLYYGKKHGKNQVVIEDKAD